MRKYSSRIFAIDNMYKVRLSWTDFNVPRMTELGNYAKGLYNYYLNCIKVVAEMKKQNEAIRVEAAKDQLLKKQYDNLDIIIKEFEQILPKKPNSIATPEEFKNAVVMLTGQKREKIIQNYINETQKRIQIAENEKNKLPDTDVYNDKNSYEKVQKRKAYIEEISDLKDDLSLLNKIRQNGEDRGLIM